MTPKLKKNENLAITSSWLAANLKDSAERQAYKIFLQLNQGG